MAGSLLPDGFAGNVRLFPLPDLVLFPHVVQPLRLFEPRYVRLLEDALEDDQLITMALLKPGWESNHDSAPPVHSTVCVGRIVHHSRQSDGTFHILLAGVARADVVTEPPSDLPYRIAHVDLLHDSTSSAMPASEPDLREELMAAIENSGSPGTGLDANFRQLLDQKVSLGMLTDVIAFSLGLSVEVKQDLLGTADVGVRARRLLQHVQAIGDESPRRKPYPPPFSDN